MSRKGIYIRVLIFGPLLAYFGYGAVQKWRAEQALERSEAEARAAREAELGAATKTVKLGDGRSIDIVELTPEQAERLHGIKVSEGLEKAKEAEAKAGAEVKTGDAAPGAGAGAPAAGDGKAPTVGGGGEVKTGDAAAAAPVAGAAPGAN